MKVALVYDRVNKWGGAERVLLSLHKAFPNAPLFTSVYDKKKAPWAKVFKVKTSFLQHIPFLKSHHEYVPFLMPFAFASFSFKEYDMVISVTSEFAKGIIVPPQTKHLCICLTPTRYLWSGYNEYFKNKWFRLLASPLVFLLQRYDKMIAQMPDAFVAISYEVKKRIKKYYGRESDVVYPPVIKLPKPAKNPYFEKDYFLTVARLSRFTQYKRVDIAVKAAVQLNASLVVVGDGDKKYFENLGGSTIHFTGKVSDKQLSLFYKNAQALIFPGKEDFGIAMVEALSFGVPVVAFNGGGAREIVERRKTGLLFSNQTVPSLVKTLKKFKRSNYNRLDCQKRAQFFSEKEFLRKIKEISRNLKNL